jgi:hypothetical protein
MKIPYPELHDGDITKEDDGTWTVSLAPWFDEPIKGIPTQQLAREICHAAYEAMKEYASNAMMD